MKKSIATIADGARHLSPQCRLQASIPQLLLDWIVSSTTVNTVVAYYGVKCAYVLILKRQQKNNPQSSLTSPPRTRRPRKYSHQPSRRFAVHTHFCTMHI